MTDEQKQPYNKLSEDDRVRYNKQIQDILNQGFFLFENGERSCDTQKKEKKVKKNHNASEQTKPSTGVLSQNFYSEGSSIKSQKQQLKRAAV